MSQVTNYDISLSPLSMADLKVELEAIFDAIGSANRGATAPENPFEGMFWWDSNANPEILKRYTVTGGWASILSINITTGAVTILNLAETIVTFAALGVAPETTDIFPMVDDPGGTPVAKKITLANLLLGINKLTELEATPEDTDMVGIIDNPDETPAIKKITIANLLGGITSMLGSAAVEDVGVEIGDVVQLENVGEAPGLPEVDGSQLTGIVPGVGTVDQEAIADAAVGQGELKTSTGTASGSIPYTSGVSIAMNPYCFYPNTYVDAQANVHQTGHSSDGGSADAPRLGFYNSHSELTKNYVVDWRYITA